ncbi:hypothetical protein EHV15_35245 [Paenibacillus oralis]|uniref:Uncharacterized protein n=1 Tax=Paenibacillus oralis TaxID=2490856 RepID=A0A3P3T9W6_9BACL|nr:hypothetical protein [Paenibacillus oralis]RRJ54831.1 hypothetical protein EHV15_35245 [Paenibacillus oralis]
MKKNISEILEQAGVTIDDLVSAINLAGGRDPGTPIIYSEKCEIATCGKVFFSVTQDHFMRLNNNHPTHCPTCREAIRRKKKAELKRNKYSRK